MKYKSQRTITMLPSSDEHLETSLQEELDLWLNAQKFIRKVNIQIIRTHPSKDRFLGFCRGITKITIDQYLLWTKIKILNKILSKSNPAIC